MSREPKPKLAPNALLHTNTAALGRANEILERLLAGKVERAEPRADKLAEDGPALGLARTWMFDSDAWRALVACAPDHADRFLCWARRYAARARAQRALTEAVANAEG